MCVCVTELGYNEGLSLTEEIFPLSEADILDLEPSLIPFYLIIPMDICQ